MKLIILTGMSGAGKSLVADYLEDMGYFCIDNMPPQLLTALVKIYSQKIMSSEMDSSSSGRLAFVMDVRSSEYFGDLPKVFQELEELQIDYQIVYLEAKNQVLINRYKQSRRNHPLAKKYGLEKAIAIEREQLSLIKEKAELVIDTSYLSNNELRDVIFKKFSEGHTDERMTILVQSFGFKYGVPLDCDIVLDVRFIPNPYYLPELRKFSGMDEKVQEYIYAFPETEEFLDLQTNFFKFAIPYYVREGKVRLIVGIGCTGGRHRSVALTEDLAARLHQVTNEKITVITAHRDLEKDVRDKE